MISMEANITIFLSGNKLYGNIISKREKGSDKSVILGIEFVRVDTDFFNRTNRYKLDPKIPLTAWGKEPYKLNQINYYNISEFSSNGMTLEFLDSSYILLPNTSINLEINILGKATFKIECHIKNIRQNKTKDSTYFMGVEFHNPSCYFLEAITCHILRHPTENITLKELKENNFITPFDLSTVIKTIYVSTPSEYLEFLKLRLAAQQNEGRWVNESDPYNTIDKFDASARKIMFKIGTQVVAIGRVVFSDSHLGSEHADCVEIPEFLKT